MVVKCEFDSMVFVASGCHHIRQRTGRMQFGVVYYVTTSLTGARNCPRSYPLSGHHITSQVINVINVCQVS